MRCRLAVCLTLVLSASCSNQAPDPAPAAAVPAQLDPVPAEHPPVAPLPDPDPTDDLVVGTARSSVPMYAATSGLVAVSLAIVVFAGPLSAVTARAGEDLVDREPYRVAVLGAEMPG